MYVSFVSCTPRRIFSHATRALRIAGPFIHTTFRVSVFAYSVCASVWDLPVEGRPQIHRCVFWGCAKRCVREAWCGCVKDDIFGGGDLLGGRENEGEEGRGTTKSGRC